MGDTWNWIKLSILMAPKVLWEKIKKARKKK